MVVIQGANRAIYNVGVVGKNNFAVEKWAELGTNRALRDAAQLFLLFLAESGSQGEQGTGGTHNDMG